MLRSVERIRWVIALIGISPLGAFALAHVWMHARARGGTLPDALRASHTATAPLVVLGALILGSAAVHVGLGLSVALGERRAPARPLAPPRAVRVTALGSGLLALLFLILHTAELVVPVMVGRTSPASAHEWLRAALSSASGGVPWRALGYLLGITAVAVHLGLGLRLTCERWRLASSPLTRRLATLASVLLAAALLLVGGNVVIELATGSGLDALPPRPAARARPQGDPTGCPAPSATRPKAPWVLPVVPGPEPASGAPPLEAPP